MLVKSYELAYNVDKKTSVTLMKFTDYNSTALDFVIKLTKGIDSPIDLRGAKVTIGVLKPDNSVDIHQIANNTNVDLYISFNDNLKDILGMYKGYIVIHNKKDIYTLGPISYQVTKAKTISQLSNNTLEDTNLALFNDILLKLKRLNGNGYQEAYNTLLRSFDSLLMMPSLSVTTDKSNSDIASEATRQAFEEARKSAEELRNNNETLRKINEQERIQNESLRQHNESLRKIAYEKYITALDTLNQDFNDVFDRVQTQVDDILNSVIQNEGERQEIFNELHSDMLEIQDDFKELEDSLDEFSNDLSDKKEEVDEMMSNIDEALDNVTTTFNDNEQLRMNIFNANENIRQDTFETNEANRQELFDTNESIRQGIFEEAVRAEGERQETFETNEASRQNTFNTSEASRQNTFNTSEASRQNTFNSKENTRQTTFETNEANRQELFEANEKAREDAFNISDVGILNGLLTTQSVHEEEIKELKNINRRQNILLQGLLTEHADNMVTIGGTASQDNNVHLDYSKDNGLLFINSLQGKTLVNANKTPSLSNILLDKINLQNELKILDTVEGGMVNTIVEGNTLVNVCDQEEPIAITKSYTVEGTNHVPLEGEYDGKCRPVVYGNTLVNVCDQKDPVAITKSYTVENSGNHIPLQGEYDGKARPVVHGNTLVNRAGDTFYKTDKLDIVGNEHTITNGLDGEKVGVESIKGNTLVNVCDQKDPVAITKSYAVENSGNHIPLQGEYDGKCRPVIQGNTIVNLAKPSLATQDNIITYTVTSSDPYYFGDEHTWIRNIDNTKTHTIILNILENTVGADVKIYNYGSYAYFPFRPINIPVGTTGMQIYTTIQRTENSQSPSDWTCLPLGHSEGATIGGVFKYQVMIFEGDLTQTPNLIPTEYVEGLKSSFENNKIPEDITKDLEEKIVSGTSLDIPISNIKPSTTYTIYAPSLVGKNIALRFRNGNDNTELSTALNSTTQFTNPQIIETFDSSHDFSNVYLRYFIYGDKMSTKDIRIFEGDYSHLTEEDFKNEGKYKAEYKVTGKNKFDLNKPFNVKYGSNIGVPIISGNGIIPNGKIGDYSSVSQDYSDIIKQNTNYTISFYSENVEHNCRICDNSTRTDIIPPFKVGANVRGHASFNIENRNPADIRIIFHASVDNDIYRILDIQIEEGTEATEYEPYKEYTKTFYLNSPLLEGDTIEDVNGVATHVKRYEKVVLDGSENWSISSPTNFPPYVITELPYYAYGNSLNDSANKKIFCDKISIASISANTNKGICTAISGSDISNGNVIRLRVTDDDTVGSVKQWLQANPVTVVYQLASPIYEPISSESILCDSYVNGHLDFDSAVPIQKVQFKEGVNQYLNYLYENTNYTLQFESDNVGRMDLVNIGGNNSSTFVVKKGLNKIQLSTASVYHTKIIMHGIGFNASNIQVVATEATDKEFGYFNGIQSSFEDGLITDENDPNFGKYKVEYKVTGKNKFDISIFDSADDWLSDVYDYYKIQLKPNTTYTITQSTGKTSDDFLDSFSCISATSDYHEFVRRPNTIWIVHNNHNKTQTVMTTDETGCLYFNMYRFLSGKIDLPAYINLIDSKNIQIEEGTTATAYEPYKEDTFQLQLNSPLLKDDEIRVQDGWLGHYHKYGKVVLDGSEVWYNLGSYSDNNHMTFNITSFSCIKNSLICDKISPTKYELLSSKQYEWITSSGANIIIKIAKLKLTTQDLNGFKQWLQANPTTVVYELRTPYFEPLVQINSLELDLYNTNSTIAINSTIPVQSQELNVYENTRVRPLIVMPKIESIANNEHTITDGLDGGKVEIESIKGNTLVNLVQEKNLNSYHYSGTSSFTRTMNGNFCIYESTLDAESANTGQFTIRTGAHTLMKANTSYTVIFTIKENTLPSGYCGISIRGTKDAFYGSEDKSIYLDTKFSPTVGIHKIVITLPSDITSYAGLGIGFPLITAISGSFRFVIGEVMIFEGDLTQTPELIPAEYVEGLKSSFEVEENKVDVKVVGKNKFNNDNMIVGNPTGYGYMYIDDNETHTLSLIEKDSSVDLTGIYFGFTGNGVSPNKGVLWVVDNGTVKTTISSVNGLKYFSIHPNNQNTLNKILSRFDIQIEEGTAATPYEPYKENSYQLQLNSPLLKDDEIRVQDGYLGHYHKMGKQLIDENYSVWFSTHTIPNHTRVYMYKEVLELTPKEQTPVIQDRLPHQTTNIQDVDVPGIYITNTLDFQIPNSELSELGTKEAIYEWLRKQPVTVVYELGTPYFEPLVKVDSLALDIYNTNSTITIDSAIPVQQSTVKNLSYRLQGFSEPYTLKYNADGEVTTEIVDNRLRFYGEGATIKDVILVDGENTPTGDYFQGLQSSFEDSLVTDETDENYGKYKVEYKVTGKNKFDGKLINGSLNNDTGELTLSPAALDSVVSVNYIKVIPGTTYTISNDLNYSNYIYEYDLNMNYINFYKFNNTSSFTTLNNTYYVKIRSIGTTTQNDLSVKYQLEEGETATEYEPYKEYTKTFYLNSPLLEGDTIEDVNGVATHVKRYEKVVLDGSHENLVLYSSNDIAICFQYTNVTKFADGNWVSAGKCINDKGFHSGNSMSVISLVDDVHMFAIGFSDIYTYISIPKSQLATPDKDGFKQWLQSNTVTLVYQLASPIREPISTESILCDSYVNGHLDFDTNVPVENVNFIQFITSINYTISNTTYILQFDSDNTGYLNGINLGGTNYNIRKDVVKGVNKFTINTADAPNPSLLRINGIGFNASNIVITEATDTEFGYFKGIQSTFEDSLVTDENDENYGKYKVEIISGASSMIFGKGGRL